MKLVLLDQLLLSQKTTQKLSTDKRSASLWQPEPRDTALGMNNLEQQGHRRGEKMPGSIWRASPLQFIQ